MERRSYLGLSAGALAVLTGCVGDDGDGGTTTATTRETTTTEATATEATTTTDTTTTTETTATTDTTATETTATETTAETVDSVTVRVGPDGNLRFAPETFRLTVGGTVTWEWDSSGHNVIADATPEGSDWEGTAGGTGETYGEGHTYEYTFDVAGDYEYYCAPHRNFGMVGSFTVEQQ